MELNYEKDEDDNGGLNLGDGDSEDSQDYYQEKAP
jgi:hypothetical protein